MCAQKIILKCDTFFDLCGAIMSFRQFGFVWRAKKRARSSLNFKVVTFAMHPLHALSIYDPARLSHVHGIARSLSVITAHRDRDLAFSLKELQAWNFLQTRGAAFPQYGKGVDNVNDTAGASVGNSGRAQPRNIDVPRRQVRRRQVVNRRTNRNNIDDESRGRVFSRSKIRRVRQDLSDCCTARDGNAFYRLSARANGFQQSTSLFLSNKRLVRRSMVRFHALFRKQVGFCCRLVSSKFWLLLRLNTAVFMT